MPFAYAIAQLADGQSAKRPNMNGRVDKVTSVDGTTFTLTFRKRNGTTYEYTYTIGDNTWTAPATTIPVDAEFLAMMLAQDWQIVETADITNGTW